MALTKMCGPSTDTFRLAWTAKTFCTKRMPIVRAANARLPLSSTIDAWRSPIIRTMRRHGPRHRGRPPSPDRYARRQREHAYRAERERIVGLTVAASAADDHAPRWQRLGMRLEPRDAQFGTRFCDGIRVRVGEVHIAVTLWTVTNVVARRELELLPFAGTSLYPCRAQPHCSLVAHDVRNVPPPTALSSDTFTSKRG